MSSIIFLFYIDAKLSFDPASGSTTQRFVWSVDDSGDFVSFVVSDDCLVSVSIFLIGLYSQARFVGLMFSVFSNDVLVYVNDGFHP